MLDEMKEFDFLNDLNISESQNEIDVSESKNIEI